MISPSLTVDQLMNMLSPHCIPDPVNMINIEIGFNESVYLTELQVTGDPFSFSVLPYTDEPAAVYTNSFGFSVSQ